MPNLADGTPEAFNAVIALNSLTENSDSVTCFDNEALADMAKRKLSKPSPTLDDMNRLVA